MFIELIGMVGAGKSTIAAPLTDLLQAKGFTVMSLPEAIYLCLDRSLVGQLLGTLMPSVKWRRRLLRGIYVCSFRPFYKAQFMLQHSKLTWETYKSQLDRDLSWRHRRIILNLFFRLAASQGYVRERLHADEVVVLEEGLLHRAVNLYAWEKSELNDTLLWRYFESLPVLDLALFVQTPISVCLERVNGRGYPSRLGQKDPDTINKFMENAAHIIQIAARFLRTAEREVIEVDNSLTVEHSTAALKKDLDLYLSRMFTPSHHAVQLNAINDTF